MPASAQNRIVVGKSTEVASWFKQKAVSHTTNASGINLNKQISHTIPGHAPLVLNLNSAKKEGKAEIFSGEINNIKNSNFFLKIADNDLSGLILLRDQNKAYQYSSAANGSTYLEEVDIDNVVCAEYQQGPVANASNSDPLTAAAIPDLQSLPGAEAVVLLDFDGQYVDNPYWNNGNPINAAPAKLSATEIVEVWKLISEDYRPFMLNITTSEAVYLKAQPNRRLRAIFTPTNTAAPGSGGVAYINFFTKGNETPCWIFNSGIKGAGDAGSHEIGHVLGLLHDGRTSPSESYFMGAGSWAPIMGAGYNKQLVQWSKGEYAAANNQEDDLAIIATKNGFTYKADDHGNTNATATTLKLDNTGNVSATNNPGIITTRNDIDVFTFQTNGGAVALTVNPSPYYANLDVILTLKNVADGTVTVADPAGLSASINQTLPAGTYYLHVDGSKGTLGANSDYASIGEYSISGTITGGNNSSPTVSITTPVSGNSFVAPANITLTAAATTPNGTISKVEFLNGIIKLGEDLTAPYSLTWNAVNAGTYNITAKSYTSQGVNVTSAVVAVNVTEPTQNQSPTVAITTVKPNAGYTAPATIALTSSASDADGTVTKVEYYNGDTKLGEAVNAPYEFSWKEVKVGTYSITARAIDDEGAITNSEAISFTVINSTVKNQAPAIVITKPTTSNSFTAPATFTIEADASDPDGIIRKVEFFSGSIKLGEDRTAPYTYTWEKVNVGINRLTARATDDKGIVTTSTPVVISVRSNTPPSIVINPIDSSKELVAPATITFTTVAKDTEGRISKVEFFSGSIKLGEDRTAPFTFKWENVQAGTNSITAKATDSKGATTISEQILVTINENVAQVVDVTSITDSSYSVLATSKVVEEASAVEAPQLESGEVLVYPNPVLAGGKVKVSLSEKYLQVQATLYDMATGKKVFARTFYNVSDFELNLPAGVSGQFALTMVSGNKKWTKKILVN